MKHLFLPTLLGCFALLSITTLYGLDKALAIRQLIFFLAGFGLFFFFRNIRFSKMLSLANIFYGATIVLLLIALLFSSEIRNTNRWINLGFFNLQPSQLAIPSLALILSGLTQKKMTSNSLLTMLGLTLLPAVLIFLEPDLSMTLLVLVTAGSILWLQPIPIKAYVLSGVLSIVLLATSWIWLLQPYQKERVESFMRPSSVMTAATYNVEQSKIAVGSGRVFGRGIQRGTQSQLQFLPEKETDFIFASFSEEFGWLGSMLVVSLYASLLTYLLKLARSASFIAGKMFLISILVVFSAQIVINIGMNLGMLPVTGIALPLLSYGGSSLLATCLIFGIVQSIAIETTNRSQLTRSRYI